MKRETGCDAVMIGRGAMGNPWLFRTLAALERGAARSRAADAGRAARGLAPSRRRWSSSTARRRCACTSCARRWPGTRAACTRGAALRQRASTVGDPAALLEMGEAFFADLRGGARRAGDGALATTPADPVAKSVARNNRRDGRNVEAEEPCAVAS